MLHAESSNTAWDRNIQDGDLVVVYERFDSLKAVVVNSRSEFSNRFGHFQMKVSAQTYQFVVAVRVTQFSLAKACCHSHSGDGPGE